MKNGVSKKEQALMLSALAWIASAQPAAAGASEEDMVAGYLTIQEKLAADSVQEVAASADRLAAAARELAEQGKHSKELEAIAAAAERMTGTDLSVLRSAFGPVSRAMAVYAEKAGLDLGLYYCPMKDAYWLQRGDEIENPYQGKSMLGCGQKAEKVKE
jgi:hypothetical protein